MRTWGKAALILIVLQVVLLLVALINGPEVWVLKYDFSGQPTSTVSKGAFIGGFLIYSLFINGLINGIWLKINKMNSISGVNFPNKDYWQRKENRKEGLRRVLMSLDLTLVFINLINLLIIALSWDVRSPVVTRLSTLGIFLLAAGLILTVYRLAQPGKTIKT